MSVIQPTVIHPFRTTTIANPTFLRIYHQVDCRDRQAERSLVTDLLSFNPRTRRLPPEVAAVSAVSLQDGKALLEVSVEGALTAKAWLAASTPIDATGGDVAAAPGADGGGPAPTSLVMADDRVEGKHAAPQATSVVSSFKSEEFQIGVWAVMVQALRGLAAVHTLKDGSVHRAVCLSNILVAARSTNQKTPTAASAATGRGSSSAPAMPHGFRRAQLGTPSPAALAQPPAACVAPEVVRGQEFRQPADVYAFGCALRAACCGAQHPESFYATGGGKEHHPAVQF